MSEGYEQAKELAEAGDVEGAWKIVNRFLQDDPNDYRALVTASFLMRRIGHLPEAYWFAKGSTQIRPQDAATWINLGHAASEMWLVDESEKCYRTALRCPNIKSEKLRDNTLLNLSALYIDNGRYADALPNAMQVLESDPSSESAKANVGFCQLATRKWAQGWKNYRSTMGSEWRPKSNYKGEPDWDGEPGKTVVIYGEQGIGDEISFASMIPDAVKHCRKVILDCDPRLAGLFKRSFPAATVYGTRTAKPGTKWDKADREFDASLPIGQIGEYFRTSADDFPGTPYLVPCPDRLRQWKSLFASKGKPVIGIAWRGGIPKTNARNRQLMLDDLLPIFKQVDAHYVSLQYKDATKEIAEFGERHPEVDIAQYRWGTLTSDYDDTAAMIAAMDYVVCIQTAVAHTAGALGTPVTVLVPVASQWRYGTAHDSIPWYNCLRVIRQKKHGEWSAEILRAAREMHGHFGRLSEGAAEAARDDGIRDDVNRLRADGLADHRANGHHASA